MTDLSKTEGQQPALLGAGGSLPFLLEWHVGPAEGGGGTAGTDEKGVPQWFDGDTLLVIVETDDGREFVVVHIDCDEHYFRVIESSTGEDYDAWAPDCWSWWARLDAKNLPPREANKPSDQP